RQDVLGVGFWGTGRLGAGSNRDRHRWRVLRLRARAVAHRRLRRFVTFERTLQSGIEDLGYARRVAQLRAYYFDNAPELAPYLLSILPERRFLFAAQGLRSGYVLQAF